MDVSLLQRPVGDGLKQSGKRRGQGSKNKDVEKPGGEVSDLMNKKFEVSEKLANSRSKKDLSQTDLTERLLSENSKIEAGSIENLSEDCENRKNKRKKKKKATIQDEVQRMEPTNRDQMNDNLEASEIVDSKLKEDHFGKDVTEQPLPETPKKKKKKKRKNNTKMTKGTIQDEVQRMKPTNRDQMNDNLEAPVILNSKLEKDHFEKDITDERPLSETPKKKKKKKKKKGVIQDAVQSMEPTIGDQMNYNLEASEKVGNSTSKDFFETDLTEPPFSENSKIVSGSIENLSENRKKKRKKKKATIQDEVQRIQLENRDQINDHLEASEIADSKLKKDNFEKDISKQPLSENPKEKGGSIENLSEKSENREKKRKKKKRRIQGEAQSMVPTNQDQMNDNLESSENVANSKSKDLLVTNLTELPLFENSKIVAGSTENLSEDCQNRKKKRKKKKKMVTSQDDVQSIEPTNRDQMNHDLDASEEVANSRLKKDNFEIDVSELALSEIPKIDAGSIENLSEECTDKKKKRKKKKKATIQDEAQRMELKNRDEMNDNLEVSENVANCKLKNDLSETDLKEPFPENQKIDAGLIESILEECATRKKKRKKKAKIQSIEPTKTAIESKENLAEAGNENIKKEEIKEDTSMNQTQMNTTTTENLAEEDVIGKGKRKRKSSKKGKNNNEAQNTSEARSILNLNVSDESEFSLRKEDGPCHSDHKMNGEAEKGSSLYPKMGQSISIRRKLLVLDVNGLLADIMMCPAHQCTGDARILGRSVHRRPFCDDFLKFCFQNFDVGIWSSRSMKVIHPIVDFLLGDTKKKLLFCWDMSRCTQTGVKTLDNKHKPLVCKELREIWTNSDGVLPCKKGVYNESNTLLLDDSPYKALLNPLHTAIFPYSYSYVDKEKDNSLGPEGDLRAYLEGLLKYDNVQKYVEQHPFGQKAISEEHSSWTFYKKILSRFSPRWK